MNQINDINVLEFLIISRLKELGFDSDNRTGMFVLFLKNNLEYHQLMYEFLQDKSLTRHDRDKIFRYAEKITDYTPRKIIIGD